MHIYATSLPRAGLGLVVGALAGAALVAFWGLWGLSLSDLREHGLRTWFFAFSSAVFVWAVGLFVVAPLPWLVLHRMNVRSWLGAAALGAVLTFVAVVAITTYGFGLGSPGTFSAGDSGGPTWIDGRLTAHGWAEIGKFALACSVIGALVGLIVARVAYRRVPVAN
jgi:hypothetical protein